MAALGDVADTCAATDQRTVIAADYIEPRSILIMGDLKGDACASAESEEIIPLLVSFHAILSSIIDLHTDVLLRETARFAQ